MSKPTHYAIVLRSNRPAYTKADDWEKGDVIELREASKVNGTQPFLEGDLFVPGIAIVPMTLTDEEADDLSEGRKQVDINDLPEAERGNMTKLGGKIKARKKAKVKQALPAQMEEIRRDARGE